MNKFSFIFILFVSVSAQAGGKELCTLSFNSNFSEVFFAPNKESKHRQVAPIKCRILQIQVSPGWKPAGLRIINAGADVDLICESNSSPRMQMHWIFHHLYGIIVSRSHVIKFDGGHLCELQAKATEDAPAPGSPEDLKPLQTTPLD